jgi:hypothetical protein
VVSKRLRRGGGDGAVGVAIVVLVPALNVDVKEDALGAVRGTGIGPVDSPAAPRGRFFFL